MGQLARAGRAAPTRLAAARSACAFLRHELYVHAQGFTADVKPVSGNVRRDCNALQGFACAEFAIGIGSDYQEQPRNLHELPAKRFPRWPAHFSNRVLRQFAHVSLK